ncbi:MAG: hypothetical protein ACXWV9_07665 [Flavisolibacter sp.]
MTTKNNNQPASSLPNDDLSMTSSFNLAKIVSLNIRYDAAPKQLPVRMKEESVKVIRRYSFDDNGGGYLGL